MSNTKDIYNWNTAPCTFIIVQESYLTSGSQVKSDNESYCIWNNHTISSFDTLLMDDSKYRGIQLICST